MTPKPKKDHRVSRLITCSRCGLERRTKITGREICFGCYRKEPSSHCLKCGILRHFVDPQTGICPRCEGKSIPDKIDASLELPSYIKCIKCGRTRFREFRNLDLCRDCYSDEETIRCKRCGKQSHFAEKQRQLCPPCAVISARPIGPCAKCFNEEPLYDETDRLCYRCHEIKRQRLRKQSLRIKATCSDCGKMCHSAQIGVHICYKCTLKKYNGIKNCNKCGKDKLIQNKEHNICRQCYLGKSAPKLLQDYISRFASPFTYNNNLFRLVAAGVKWKHVTYWKYHCFRKFGEFLQAWEFKEPITWEQIKEAEVELGLAYKKRAKQVREILSDLGSLLASQDILEDYSKYLSRRSALSAIGAAPEQTHNILRRYAFWLKDHDRSWASIKKHTTALASFLSWCWLRKIESPGEVQRLHVTDYFLAKRWQWKCKNCNRKTVLDSLGGKEPTDCINCGTTESMEYVVPNPKSLRALRSYLKVFFDWARIERLVVINPVQEKIEVPPEQIKHYPTELIQQLVTYITKPEADPLEAIVLYLIIAYAFTGWEIRHAQLPSLVALDNDARCPSLAEIYGVVVPKPEPSIGNHAPGRPDSFVKFRAKDALWLKPLLERVQQYRKEILKGRESRYLLITRETTRNEKPVSRKTVYRLVRRASVIALGAACNPRTLRKTMGIIYTDRNNSSVLTWMGWSNSQTSKYDFALRKEILPRKDLKGKIASGTYKTLRPR
jgi:hypothetical protein